MRKFYSKTLMNMLNNLRKNYYIFNDTSYLKTLIFYYIMTINK